MDSPPLAAFGCEGLKLTGRSMSLEERRKKKKIIYIYIKQSYTSIFIQNILNH